MNKMEYAVMGCMLSAVLCTTATAQTLMEIGPVAMENGIIATACAIEMNSRDQAVEMATIPVSKIARDGHGIAKPFAIHLINCILHPMDPALPDWQTFRVTFDGTPDGQLLGVEGDARGVGLQIKDRHGNIALPGVPLPAAELSPGDKVLQYTSNLLPNQQVLRAGEYRSTVRFKMDYY